MGESKREQLLVSRRFMARTVSPKLLGGILERSSFRFWVCETSSSAMVET